MSEVIVRAEGLAKAFVDGVGRRTVLDGVDVEASTGRIVGVRGRSGCGKSTLLRIASGLLRPDAGRVVLAGAVLDFERPRDVARARRAHVGVISQALGLINEESVRENVELPLTFGTPRARRHERLARVDAALARVGLDVDPKARVAVLSGGEKQRVAIARALVRMPALLVADEPTAALDDETGATITALLREVAASGVAVLVATHDEQVVQACDTVLRFDGPRLVHAAPSLT